jgi:YVTN family beta-propeller protein
VTAITTATNTVLKNIGVGRGPDAIAITPDGTTAYVTNNIGSHVTPIDTATNAALTPISTLKGPDAIAFTPDGATAYVTCVCKSGGVIPISTGSNTAGPPILSRAIGPRPIAIEITPNGKTAYVINYDSGTITPIVTATNAVGNAIKLGDRAHPVALAITQDGKTVYVVSAAAQTVTPVTVATNKALKPIKVGRNPTAIVIKP